MEDAYFENGIVYVHGKVGHGEQPCALARSDPRVQAVGTLRDDGTVVGADGVALGKVGCCGPVSHLAPTTCRGCVRWVQVTEQSKPAVQQQQAAERRLTKKEILAK